MNRRLGIIFISLIIVSFTLVSFEHAPVSDTPKTLYDSIVMMDTRWEDAYDNCKMDVMEELISEDLEFFHDQGGLLTSKKLLNEALRNNICGKVSRELKAGSIEVFPIPGYGAVEMGLHGFHNKQQQHADHYAKFVHIWKRENGQWKIKRAIRLH